MITTALLMPKDLRSTYRTSGPHGLHDHANRNDAPAQSAVPYPQTARLLHSFQIFRRAQLRMRPFFRAVTFRGS